MPGLAYGLAQPMSAHYLMWRIRKPRTRRGFFSGPGGRALSAAERTASLTGALWTLLCFVDAQRPAIHLKAVQGLNSALRFGLGHIDESETAWLAGFPVVDELYRFHFTVTFKQRLHVLFCGVEGQIAHVNRRHPRVSLGKADSGDPHASVACTAWTVKQVKASRHTIGSFSQCAALGPAACTCVRARMSRAGREMKSTTFKRDQSALIHDGYEREGHATPGPCGRQIRVLWQ